MNDYDKVSTIDGLHEQLIKWHEDLHRRPETALQEAHTANYIAQALKDMGYEVHEHIGKTGLVAVLRVGDGKKSIGIRADFDALPIQEINDLPYKSCTPGKAHLCGHDAHTTMLLGAAKYLSMTKNFSGTLNLIFQPAEETMEGGDGMIRDGLFERFPMDAVYALHNGPKLPVGTMLFGRGSMMAAVDNWEITLTGRGGHGSEPESCIDPVVAGASLVMALQTIVSRNLSPHDPCVVTVGAFNAGSAGNAIPQTASLKLSIRNMDEDTRLKVLEKIRLMTKTQAECYGCNYEIKESHPGAVLVNDDECVDFAMEVARRMLGDDKVFELDKGRMGSEDFAFMLQKKRGAYFFLGNGASQALHHPQYITNQDILPIGSNYWIALVEAYLQ